MCGKLLGFIPLLLVLSAVTSCAQMSRHSNTLMFGTNTSIGIGVGQSASQTPEIDIGFRRQEVAIVPVLANTTKDGNTLGPCDVKNVADCKFQATHNGTDKDSYSTLASFGSKTGADTTGGKAEVSVAQYFATGVAAQQLVISGGANVVQAGGDTKAKAAAAEKATELKIQQEKTNAEIFAKKIDLGEVAARAILGDEADSVDDTKLVWLAASMPGPGNACSKDELRTLDMSSVGKFIKALRDVKPTCMRRLADKVNT